MKALAVLSLALSCMLLSAQVLRPMLETIRGSQDNMGVFYTFINMPALRPLYNVIAAGDLKTLFIPTNEALNEAQLPGDASTLALFQAHALGYRVRIEDWNAVGPTVFSTLLTNSSYVNLGGLGSLVKGVRSGIVYTMNWGNPVINATINPSLYFPCTDGVIYVIDKVMGIPPPLINQLAAHGLTFFNEAVSQIAGQPAIDLMNFPGVTVFVPDNEAFRSSFEGDWRSAPSGTWQNLVRFHTVRSLNFFANFTGGRVLQTDLSNQLPGRIDISVRGTGVVTMSDYMGRFLSNISAFEADIVTANGIIHVLDRVLVPNMAYKSAELAYLTLKKGE